jgi:hypothetical protein
MKLLYLIIQLIVLLLTGTLGCEEKRENKTDIPDVEFKFMSYGTEFTLHPIEFPVDIDVVELLGEKIGKITTPDDAYNLGQKIIRKMHENGRRKTSELLTLVHYQKNNVWLFEYSDNLNRDTSRFSGGLYIAIDGYNGKTIAAWVTE